MMNSKGKIIWGVVIAVIVFLGFGACSGYNTMVDSQEQATTALANVEATYQRRSDLIPNLVKTVQAYAKHEKSTFEAVTKARASVGSVNITADNLTPQRMKQFQAAQGELSSALSRLLVVAEKYPELKADRNFQDLQVQLEGTENRINEARQRYNEAVQSYNLTVRRFPNVIYAGWFGFERMQKFEAAEGADKAPEVNFD